MDGQGTLLEFPWVDVMTSVSFRQGPPTGTSAAIPKGNDGVPCFGLCELSTALPFWTGPRDAVSSQIPAFRYAPHLRRQCHLFGDAVWTYISLGTGRKDSVMNLAACFPSCDSVIRRVSCRAGDTGEPAFWKRACCSGFVNPRSAERTLPPLTGPEGKGLSRIAPRRDS
jgi:hypothetical protein